MTKSLCDHGAFMASWNLSEVPEVDLRIATTPPALAVSPFTSTDGMRVLSRASQPSARVVDMLPRGKKS